MITIDLIRHAESMMNVAMADPNRESFIGGRQNEVELSALGVQQAVKLGQYAITHDIYPDFVYSSPAERCLQTAIVSGEVMNHGLEIVIDDGLQELDQGEWTNQPRTLYEDPVNKRAMKLQEGDFAPAGGESMNQVKARIDARLSEIALRHDDGAHVWVFTHGVAIKSWVGYKLGWSHEQTYRTAIGNASLTTAINNDGTTWDITSISRSPFEASR